MRLVFAGTPEVAVPSLEALLAAGHDVVGVLTRPDAQSGRGRKLSRSPVAQRAAEHGIELLQPRRPGEPTALARLRELAPDVCPVVAYGALLPDAALAIPSHGWINLHFSLLPRWRGAAPVQRALIAGDAVTGATTFRIVRELDAGPVYRRLELPIPDDLDAGDLLADLAARGAGLLVESLADVAAGVEPSPQPTEGVTLAPKLTVDEVRIDWTASSRTIAGLVHGASPQPGAWTMLGGDRIKVFGVRRREPSGEPLAPGELQADKRQLLVGCADAVLEIALIQAVGKKPMHGADWARGVRWATGARFT